MNLSKFFQELKRRNVFRVATAYAIASWLIIQVVDTIGPQLGFPEWIPPLVTVLVLSGFPITLIIAWAFELTPDGLKKSNEVEITESVTAYTGKKLNSVTIGVLSLLVIFLLIDRFILAPPTPDPSGTPSPIAATASVAVLPFVDLSPEGDQEYFSDGISEEILNVLVRIKGLDVISRTSSFQFKGREMGIPEIARRLEARYVLEGSVRKAGNTIRITAQLIEAENDRHLYSETFDRPLNAENIFRIQDEISQSIVHTLRQTLDLNLNLKGSSFPSVSISTDNLDAYEKFLRARQLFFARRDLDEADQLLIEALEVDPNYVEAWEIRAALQSLMDEYGYATLDRNELDRRGLQYADKALSLSPDRSLALAVKAKIKRNAVEDRRAKYDLGQILEEFNVSIEKDSMIASPYNWRGLLYGMLGYVEQARSDFERCVTLEPFYTPCIENLIGAYAASGNDAEALKLFDQSLDKGLVKIEHQSFYFLARIGEERAFKAVSNSGNYLFGWPRHDELYQAYQTIEGDHSELAEDIFSFMQRKFMANDKQITRSEKYAIHFMLSPLKQDTDLSTAGIHLWDPAYSKYRRGNTFKSFYKESGILAFWQTYGFPDQCKPMGTNNFSCE